MTWIFSFLAEDLRATMKPNSFVQGQADAMRWYKSCTAICERCTAPVVGSSRKRIEGLPTRPQAMLSRLCSPPDRPRTSSPPGIAPPTCRQEPFFLQRFAGSVLISHVLCCVIKVCLYQRWQSCQTFNHYRALFAGSSRLKNRADSYVLAR